MTDARDDPAIGVIVLTGVCLLYPTQTGKACAPAVMALMLSATCCALHVKRSFGSTDSSPGRLTT